MEMKVKKWSVVSAFIMLVLPWLAVTFAPSDAGMAICLLLFYIINPIYSVVLGCIAGQKVRRFWILPLLSSLLFLAGVGILFTVRDPIFFGYAGIYLVLGLVAMLSAYLVKQRRQK